ncbi:MAG: ribonuclease E inhibitor RraB, partial [Candidatus Eremiobacteraeota bacterium]|nr:ribonuclease E inhibitor RraB [Candidatus Eremiobacteraeota bacterium]
ACTVSGGGVFRLYGYAAESGIDGIVRNAIATLAFRSDVQSAADPAWENYDRYALRGEELEEARDNEQLEQLQESGEDLSAEFETAFYINFDSVEQARGGAAALAKAGFQVSSAEVDSLMEGANEVMASRAMVMTPPTLKEARAQATAAISPFGGRYNGWGAYPEEE